jgi:dipeptidyl aminopeptidase/acylaminoacyl peptidase
LDGKTTNLTKDARADSYGDVIALAASQVAGRVAFCAIAPGADVGDQLAPSVLWSIDLDGKDAQALAVRGRTCAEPTFAPDGKTIAFVADESGATPARLSIWTVATSGGDEQRVTSADDEWSRFGPQWLDGSRLVYAATAEDGRSTLFVRTANGAEQDIGADLVKGDRYQALGRPLAAPDGSAIAVEGLRANTDGADLLLIDATGAAIPSQGQIGSGYWNRPLAWNADGTLFYLSTACASDVAQNYTIHTRVLKDGTDKLIAAGTTLGAIGQFATVDQGMAYVTLTRASAGPRGALSIESSSASALWFWDIGGSGARGKLAEAQSAISDIAP